MFGWERLWHKLIQLMTQKTYPEATALNAFRALKTATTALPDKLAAALLDGTDEAHGGALTSALIGHALCNDDACSKSRIS